MTICKKRIMNESNTITIKLPTPKGWVKKVKKPKYVFLHSIIKRFIYYLTMRKVNVDLADIIECEHKPRGYTGDYSECKKCGVLLRMGKK